MGIKTDEKLVENFLKGDESALEMLIDRYLKSLYNFSLQLVGDGQVAEDIVQEVFVKAWKNLTSFDLNKKFSTWIYAIAKNTAYDYLKKKKTIPFSSFENEQGDNALENIEDCAMLHSHELLQRMDDAQAVRKYLSTLSPQAKTILLLHHEQGFSLVEIAQIMGAPANTTKSKYRRAISSLRNLYFSKNPVLAKDSD